MLLELSTDLPIVIEIVDGRTSSGVPAAVDELVTDWLVTLETVRVVRDV